MARAAGFCFGVRRALQLTLNLAHRYPGRVYTLGPLIHNPQVIQALSAQGVRVAYSPEELDPRRAILVIRSHGIGPGLYHRVRSSRIKFCNATCPRVARVQSIVKGYAQKGYRVLVMGDPGHAEVEALLEFAGGRGVVVNRPADLESISGREPICLVAQTTQDREGFELLVGAVMERFPNALIFDTICESAVRRQEEVRRLAKIVDAMVVVGGRNSANTRRLAQVARSMGIPVIHVEVADELDPAELEGFGRVGVMAGASTPNWLIQQVILRLEGLEGRRGLSFWWRRVLRSLSLSNGYVAFGAACLSYACCRLQGIEPKLAFEFIAGFYIFGMHLLNHFTDRAVTYNEPARVEFYDRYRPQLIGLGVASAIGALLLAGFLGLLPFLFLLGMTGLGVLYRVKVVPGRFNLRYRRLADIPASKDIFLALAWAVVLVVLHLLSVGERFSLATLVAFGFTFGLAFIRSVVYSIRDFYGDMIVGRETIPMLFGVGRTKVWLAGMGVALVALLMAGVELGWTSSLGYWLIGVVAYTILYQWLFYRGVIAPGGWAELVIDTSFVLAGATAYLWYLVG